MDGLGIAKAHLAGWSIGGNEITAMAAAHPEPVDRIVYLEGAYDWADPAFVAAFKALPPIYMTPPASALTSLDAYRAYQRTVWFPMSTPSGLAVAAAYSAFTTSGPQERPNEAPASPVCASPFHSAPGAGITLGCNKPPAQSWVRIA